MKSSDLYVSFFEQITGQATPHPWQLRLGSDPRCRDRLIRIPTGFGKTAGAVVPWLYHRIQRADLDWPTRIAFCLPMRTLVEQTERAIRTWLEAARLDGAVGLHVLMGGVEASRWRLAPERPAILVGTQDMLLSRALNRGYASGRAAWPMEFGLLQQDCLWIFDEVQLQDVGLATSAQLSAFRAQEASAGRSPLRPTYSWWMSATLQPRWLDTIDHAPHVSELEKDKTEISPKERVGGPWKVRKTVRRTEPNGLAPPESLAKLLVEQHRPGTLSLCVVNTVDRAVKVYELLEKAFSRPAKKRDGKSEASALPNAGPERRLIHSRFRGHERRAWAQGESAFLLRGAGLPEAGRIIIATQVVEAGVDLSAKLLVTDLAPWPSLVQRFGRCARYADDVDGTIIVAGGRTEDEKKALPYVPAVLAASSEALDRLIASCADAAPQSLESFEAALDDAGRAALYPYEPGFMLRRRDLEGLFDTAADLSGADLDIGRFIRTGEERDAQVFWRKGFDASRPESHPRASSVIRDELCAAPLGKIRDLLDTRTGYVFDYLDGEWRRVDPKRLYPGMRILLRAEDGGYLPEQGLAPQSKVAVAPANLPTVGDALEDASLADAGETLSHALWKTIAVHGQETATEVRRLASTLKLESNWADLLALAARWHDAGKAHIEFQRAIRDDARSSAGELGASRELAKAPEEAWRKPPPYPERPGFRHELASTLALFESLRRTRPDHPALLGPHAALFDAVGMKPVEVPASERLPADGALTAELAQLDAHAFNLVAYLVCAHHGKVRCAWSSTPKDQESGANRIHGIEDGDLLPSFSVATIDGRPEQLPPLEVSLALSSLGLNERYGASWTERVGSLLERYGPFTLAYLETLLRCADAIASGAAAPVPRRTP